MRGCLLLPAWMLLTGCDEKSAPPPPATPPPAEKASSFDPSRAGSIRGYVSWSGTPPAVAPFRSIENPLTDQNPAPQARDWPNPNAPVLTADGRLAGAVVFLRGVDPARSKPWDHPPARVELRDFAFVPSTRFVRVCDEVEFVSRQTAYHAVQARGANFATLALPDPDTPRCLRFATAGVVELLSGAGLYWMRSYLFVDQHPYYTVTDADGSFKLEGVPEGEYDLVAWHPDWRVTKWERNAESFRVQQVRFRPPIEYTARVKVVAGESTTLAVPLVVK